MFVQIAMRVVKTTPVVLGRDVRQPRLAGRVGYHTQPNVMPVLMQYSCDSAARAKSGTNTGTNRAPIHGTNHWRSQKTSIRSMVGVTGFEPATPTSRTPSAARACRQFR